MERTYKYIGTNEVEVAEVGIIKPGSLVKTSVEINNPLFEEVKSKTEKK